MNKNIEIGKLVDDLSLVEDVDAILLSGSQTTEYTDGLSDFDLYVYVKDYLAPERRKAIYGKYFSSYEIDNDFWEMEDDAVLKDPRKRIELVYRRFSWLESMLESVLIHHQARLGYTTCFWYNLLHSDILFDRMGNAAKLKKKYAMPYPEGLKINIIKKNFAVLKDCLPSYYFQIEKAIKRNDFVSVNHRISAFLASYFDVIFAVNEKTHPGEKQLIKIASETCKKLPENMKDDLEILLATMPYGDGILNTLDRLVEKMKKLIKKEKINTMPNGI